MRTLAVALALVLGRRSAAGETTRDPPEFLAAATRINTWANEDC